MNKTIHELNSLTQAQADDELIIYDVSEGESKKIQVQDLNNPNYSTTEQKTGGTWIDGKPIYRKVIELTNPTSNTLKYYPTGITNMGTPIDLRAIVHGTNIGPRSSNGWNIGYSPAQGGTAYWLGLLINNDGSEIGLMVRVNGAVDSTTGYAIIEYTKTTD